MRISPQDATFLSQDPHRLKGRKLGAFAGFLKRCAREHDLLWGRLDGAERLIALVVTAAASAAGVDKDRRAALQREYTARAMRTIIDEEATRATCSILTTIASLRHALANKAKPHAPGCEHFPPGAASPPRPRHRPWPPPAHMV